MKQLQYMAAKMDLPFSKTKCYLTGIDWIVHTLDYLTRRKTGTGNISQIVLALDGSIDIEKMRRALEEFIRQFPLVYGRPARDYNLAPYWKIYSQKGMLPLKINRYCLDGQPPGDIISVLRQTGNAPFRHPREHLAFHLIDAGKRSFAVMTFDHRLLDGRGAEAFLAMFQQRREKDGLHKKIFSGEPAHLSQWRDKFKAGKQVNRALLRLSAGKKIRVLSRSYPPGRIFKFKVIAFDKEQTAGIIQRAYSEAGYLMLMPYVLAVSLQTLHRFFNRKNIERGNYVIPVSIDRRGVKQVEQKPFFNHVSFFLFRARMEEADDISILLKVIKRQMYEQVKSGLPAALEKASFLMRILPLAVLGYLMRLPLKGEIGSFSFSYIGESLYPFSQFMGKRVDNLFHTPRAPVPPGIGIFFNRFQGRLNVTLSYLENLLSEQEADWVADNLSQRLGVGSE